MTTSGGVITCLLIIDFPDERIGGRHAFNHMHAWLTSTDEAHALKRQLEKIDGKHQIVDGYVCPRCGASPGGEL